MNIRRFACLLAVVCLAACSSATASPGRTDPGLPNGTAFDRAIPAQVLGLTFTDASGRPVSLQSLSGKTVVLTDFLTTCQEVCPMTSVNFRDVADAVTAAGAAGSVVLIEVTVDPARDDPARLAAYRSLYGAVRPDWTFWTGTPAATAALWAFLGVSFERTPVASPAPTDWLTGRPLTYDVSHQDVVFVIDPQGHERWLVQGTPNTDGAPPPPTLGSFLDDEGRSNLASPQGPSWTAHDVEAALTRVTGTPVG